MEPTRTGKEEVKLGWFEWTIIILLTGGLAVFFWIDSQQIKTKGD